MCVSCIKRVNTYLLCYILAVEAFFSSIMSKGFLNFMNEQIGIPKSVVIDNRFMLIVSAAFGVLMLLLTIINFYIVGYVFYKINFLFGLRTDFKKYIRIYSISLIPLSIAKLICATLNFSTNRLFLRLSFYNIISLIPYLETHFLSKCSEFYVSIMKVLSPLDILFISLMGYMYSKQYASKKFISTMVGIFSALVFLVSSSKLVLKIF